jgi:hypothetical protein
MTSSALGWTEPFFIPVIVVIVVWLGVYLRDNH